MSSIGKKAAETMASFTRSGWPCPVRLKLSFRNADMAENDLLRAAQSR